MDFLFTSLGPSNPHSHPQTCLTGEDTGFLPGPKTLLCFLSPEDIGPFKFQLMAPFSKTLRLDTSVAGPFCFLHILWR